MLTPASPAVGGRDSMRTRLSTRILSSAESSIETTRSWGPMKELSTFSSVVLPEPVPPDTTTLRRAATQRLRK